MGASQDQSPDQLPPSVRAAFSGFRGEVYFAAENLSTGAVLQYRADELVQTASVIKVPVMLEAFLQVEEGKLDFATPLTLYEGLKVPGAGILQDLGEGLRLPLGDAVTLMIVLSDNTATNLVIDQVGVAPVNERLRSLGFRHTALNRKVYQPAPADLPEERARFGLGVTTAGEMMRLFEMLYRNELASPASCRRMIGILKKQRDLEQIPRYLYGPSWNGVRVANKTGALDQVRNDVGLVYTPWGDCVLSLFAQASEDTKWTPDNEAALCLARLGKAILEHFRPAGRQ